jgi:RNA polymerase sigma factor for flagellar operon FliA
MGAADEMASRVEACLPLVGAIARAVSRRLPSTVEIDELVNDGVVGLIAALRRFDSTRGVGFSTYAGHRIRGAMLDGLRERDPLPRAVRRALKTSCADGSRPPSMPFLDLECAMSIPIDQEHEPESLAVEADLRRRVWEGLAALPPRDREVLVLRMVRGLTLREVAARLSLSITRTVEIQARGICRLRRFLDGEPMVRPRGRRDTVPAAGPGRSSQEADAGPANRPGTPFRTRAPESQARHAAPIL